MNPKDKKLIDEAKKEIAKVKRKFLGAVDNLIKIEAEIEARADKKKHDEWDTDEREVKRSYYAAKSDQAFEDRFYYFEPPYCRLIIG